MILRSFLLILIAGGQVVQQSGPIARNPVIQGADPHAVVIGDRLWVYPTGNRGGDQRFFAYSSSDLRNWVDHGPVLAFADIPWIKADGQATHYAWAPALVEKEGKFYFYYSVGPQGATPARIGVAVGNSPSGPFTDSGKPLLTGGNGFEAIDPMVFRDPVSGKYYFYAGGSAGAKLRTFELNDDMVSLGREILGKTPHRFTEGPFVHYREGVYVMSYSHGGWRNRTYSVHYSTSDSPTGPWTYAGVILQSDDRHKGPGHHSIFRGPGSDEWYIAYHRWNGAQGDGPYSGPRSTCIDRLFHTESGLIYPVPLNDDLPRIRRSG